MPEYNDNAICDYVMQTNSDYYCSLKDNWLLLYGNSDGIPKLLVFVNKTENMSPASEEEKYNINLGCKIAHFLKLPFMCVRFMPHNEQLSVWESKTWKNLTYDRLRDLFEKYYKGQAHMIADFWMPNKNWKGCDVNDPSARVLSNYGASGI